MALVVDDRESEDVDGLLVSVRTVFTSPVGRDVLAHLPIPSILCSRILCVDREVNGTSCVGVLEVKLSREATETSPDEICDIRNALVAFPGDSACVVGGYHNREEYRCLQRTGQGLLDDLEAVLLHEVVLRDPQKGGGVVQADPRSVGENDLPHLAEGVLPEPPSEFHDVPLEDGVLISWAICAEVSEFGSLRHNQSIWMPKVVEETFWKV